MDPIDEIQRLIADGAPDVLSKIAEVLGCTQGTARELMAWRERFPQYHYRPQDDCVALR